MTKRPASPRAAAGEGRAALERLARPVGEFDASRYFRSDGEMEFFNVGTGRVRQMAVAIVRDHPEWTAADAIAFADTLIGDPVLEVKQLAVEVVARLRRELVPSHLKVLKRWLSSGSANNWATTDAICGYLIGPLVDAHPPLAPEIATWVTHRSLWVRRAAAVSLVGSARRGRHLDLAYAVALALRGDRADLIHKAAGWLLREAGRTDMPRLERYLHRYGQDTPRTTIRYALERFPPDRRRALLAASRATRAPRRR